MLLRDLPGKVGDKRDVTTTISLLTGQRGEPFYLHVMPLNARGSDTAVSAGARRRLWARFRSLPPVEAEAEVVELGMLGYRNRDIAATLRATPVTIKKHLTHVFDKVGVDTGPSSWLRLA